MNCPLAWRGWVQVEVWARGENMGYDTIVVAVLVCIVA